MGPGGAPNLVTKIKGCKFVELSSFCKVVSSHEKKQEQEQGARAAVEVVFVTLLVCKFVERNRSESSS